MSLTYTDKVRIQKEVVLGVPNIGGESSDAADYRKSIAKDFADANAKGWMLDYPCEWDEPSTLQVSANNPYHKA